MFDLAEQKYGKLHGRLTFVKASSPDTGSALEETYVLEVHADNATTLTCGENNHIAYVRNTCNKRIMLYTHLLTFYDEIFSFIHKNNLDI